jgi:predicted nuclease of predicted toxin-antitoxin system
MKILFDENINKRLKELLKDFDVWTLKEMNWLGKKNGELLALADENDFRVLITNDSNLRYQQNLTKFNLNIVVLISRDNHFDSFLPLIDKLRSVLNELKESPASKKYVEVSV